MELQSIAIGRALLWERTADGVRFQCVAAGLVAANVTLSAVAPHILRVRVTPGAVALPKGFSYVVARPATPRFSVQEAEGRVRLTTERLVVEVGLEPWCLTFRTANGRLLTHEIPGDVNFGGHRLAPPPGFQVEGLPHDPARQVSAVVETLLLDPEDHFYGGGEKFTRLDHVGRTIRTWQRNPYGTRTELAYKNMPILVGTRGYGIFVDVPTAVTFHLGSLSNRSYTIQAAGRELDYYLIAGTPKEIVAAYTDLTGKPAVPPEWAFGLWASTAFIQATEASVKEQAARLRKEGIPCDVYHFDCFWQKPLMWCDFEWDTARFPDPPRLLKELHEQGFHNCLWENPYVAVQSAMYQEGAAKGYFLRRLDGSIYEALLWSQRSERGMGLCAIVDLTNPEAVAWFRKKHETLLAQGVDAFKTDFAEEIPEDARFHNGLTGAEMHNPYALLYQREVFETTKAHAGRAVIWGRSGAPGSQRYPGHWSGDPECTFADFASSVRGGLAAAMSGLAHWGQDMGGFWGTPSPELFVRWSQCGFFSSLSRYHGATARDPWLFGEEALRIFRQYARLRSRLVPYLYSYAWDAAETGIPLMRPMVLEFSEDPAGYAFDLQYCLGRELLISPVVSPDGWVTTYLPRGRWMDWWSGAVHEGPTTLRRQVPLQELPLYLRENSLLPLGPERNHVRERPADPLTVEAFVTMQAEFTLKSDAGQIVLRCRRQGSEAIFEASDAPCTFILRLHQCDSPTRVLADGRPLPRLEPTALTAAETGWAQEGRILAAKARARQIRIE
jgi:alpha-D-xyloside xylohydrolase